MVRSPFCPLSVSHQTMDFRCSSLVSDITCFIGLSGIVLMVVENELTFVSFDHHETYVTYLIKLMITISTIALVGLIIYYHYLSLKFFCVNNSIQHWYIALTPRRLIQIVVEICICLVHPVPRGFSPNYQPQDPLNANLSMTLTTATPISLSFITLDIALGLPSKDESFVVS